MFILYTPCPKLIKSSEDCPIRAIATATGNPWEVVYDELCAVGKRIWDAPTSRRATRSYLARIAEKVSVDNPETGGRFTVASFADSHPEGSFVLFTAGHVTCVSGGDWFDTWDCGRRSVYQAWRITEE